MSQNSLVIPNSSPLSGLNMIADANNALDTLNTLSSGASAPGSPEAGQLWHDTTNNILKLRSLDDTTWIPLFNLNETTYLSTPTYTNAVVGGARNLVIKQASTTTATVTADEVVVESGLGGFGFKIPSLNVTVNFGTNGANGLDNGSLVASSFYALYAIYNPSTATAAVLATLWSAGQSIYSGSHMPSGYTMSALIGVMLTNGSSQLVVTTQYDREVFYQSGISIFSGQTNVSSLTSQSIAGAVPPSGTKTVSGRLATGLVASVTNLPEVAADSTGTGVQIGSSYSSTVTGVNNASVNFRQLPVITSQAIYWSVGNAGGSTSSMIIQSFTF